MMIIIIIVKIFLNARSHVYLKCAHPWSRAIHKYKNTMYLDEVYERDRRIWNLDNTIK